MDSLVRTDTASGEAALTARNVALALAAGALILLYLAVGVRDHGLWSPTEPAVAGVVWNMQHGSGLAVPRINEMAYLEKPPLYYWLSLLSVKAFGLNAPALRLPSALLGLGALLSFLVAATRRYGTEVAIVAVFVTGSLFSFWEVSHRASTDAGVLFFSFLAYSIFVSGLDGVPRRPRALLDRDLGLAAVLALSFLVKNLFVPFVVLVPVTLTLAVLRRWRRIARIWLLFAAFLALVAAAWGLVLHAEGGWHFVRVAFLDNSLGRFFDLGTSARCDHVILNDARIVERQGPAFYAAPLLMLSLPWSLVVFPALWNAARHFRSSALRTFLAVGFASVPLALSLSASKVVEYLLPVSFFFGLAAAEWVQSEVRLEQRRATLLFGHVRVLCGLFAVAAVFLLAKTRTPRALEAAVVATALFAASVVLRRGRPRFPLALALVVLGESVVLAALVPALDPDKSVEPFFREILPEVADRPVVTYLRDDRNLPLINFYLGRRVTVLPSQEAVLSALSGPRRIAAIVRSRFPQGSGPHPPRLGVRRLQAVEGKRPLVCLLNYPDDGMRPSAGAP